MSGMIEWPLTTDEDDQYWACCVSMIGPPCQHGGVLELSPAEGEPEFAKFASAGWLPLCMACRAHMKSQSSRLTGQPYWECSENFRHPREMLSSEDWPDFWERHDAEPDCWECGRKDWPLTADTDGRHWCNRHQPVGISTYTPTTERNPS